MVTRQPRNEFSAGSPYGFNSRIRLGELPQEAVLAIDYAELSVDIPDGPVQPFDVWDNTTYQPRHRNGTGLNALRVNGSVKLDHPDEIRTDIEEYRKAHWGQP